MVSVLNYLTKSTKNFSKLYELQAKLDMVISASEMAIQQKPELFNTDIPEDGRVPLVTQDESSSDESDGDEESIDEVLEEVELGEEESVGEMSEDGGVKEGMDADMDIDDSVDESGEEDQLHEFADDMDS